MLEGRGRGRWICWRVGGGLVVDIYRRETFIITFNVCTEIPNASETLTKN